MIISIFMVIWTSMVNFMSKLSLKPASKRVSSLLPSSLFPQAQVWLRGLNLLSPSWIIVCSILLALNLFAGTANAANWYVRPAAAGSADGTNWTNAWSLAGIGWSSVSPGDTIWIAGGSYGGFGTSKGGSSGKPITLSRASASNAVPVAAAGWNSSFDSQIVLSSGITLSAYVTIDGNNWNPPGLPSKFGIKISCANGSKGIDMQSGNCVARNIEVAGPGFNACTVETDLIHYGNNSLISGCSLHDADVLGFSWVGNTGTTIEYSFLYNNGSNGTHMDVTYSAGGWTNSIFRYNVMFNCISESIFFDNQAAGNNMVFYGNLFCQGDSRGYGSVPIEFQNSASYGTVFLYNNTFVDWSKANNLGGSTASLNSGSKFKNNLFINSDSEWPAGDMSNNGFFGVSAKGTSPVTGNGSPFVGPWASGSGVPPATHIYADSAGSSMKGYNPAQYVGNFALAAGSWAVGKGSDLGAPYNIDMNGNNIGSNLGAFAVAGSAPQVPQAPQNLRVVPSR
jgi:hypothetical protein